MTFAYDEGDFSDSGLGQNISPIQHDSSGYGSSFITGRGNLTSTTRWDVEYPTTSASAVTSSSKYNTAGAVVSRTSPWDGTSTRTIKIGYTDNWNSSGNPSTFAYPTSVTDPANISSTVKYRYDIGANVEANSPAPAGQTYGKTSKRVYDNKGRLERDSVFVNTTEQSYTRYEFPTNGIQSQAFSTIVDTNSNGPDSADEVLSESWFDGAGRVRFSRVPHTFSGGSTATWAGTVTEYDILGRVKRQSVPTEVNSSWAPAGDDATRGFLWTYQKYDWMGRVVRKINTDGTDSPTLNDSDVLISYNGCGCSGGLETTIEGELVPRTDTTGNARRKQKSYADILGRTFKAETYEWDGTTVYSTVTSQFNGRDQVLRTRQFAGTDSSTTFQDTLATFDGHGRLKTSHRPEQRDSSNDPTFTIYNFNQDDSISSVTDARGAVTSYTYENNSGTPLRALVTGIAWTVPGGSGIEDPADVSFTYDNLGNRTQMTDGSGSTEYEYDPLSRMTSETKSFTGVTGDFTLNYTYQISGKLKSITDPFGDVVNYIDDKAARTTSVTGSTYGGVTTYASGIEFRAFGGMKEMTFGSSDSSTISYEYDNRLRVAEYEATSSVLGGGYVRRAEYEYFTDGRIKKAENLLDPGLDQNYKFDHMGRLVSTVSGQKLNNDEEMEEPFTQSIAYNAFDNMTGRSNEVWGEATSFSASYTNGRKTGGNEIYDKAGNLVDKTTSSNKYDRWKFDAAGRNAETVMRWYQPIPAPSIDRTQTIAKTFDGDGLFVKRVDTNDWFHTFPDTNSGTETKTELYVRSTVLGGQVVTKLDQDAEKKVTLVYAGSGVLAEQRVISGTPGVYWRHEDLVTSSYAKIDINGQYGGHGDDSPTSVEYDPLGGSIPTTDPNYDLIPAGLTQFKFAGDVHRPEYGCNWDGAPIRCDLMGPALRHSGSTELHVNTRTEGGYGLYTSLSAMVSTWRFTVSEVVNDEDARLRPEHYSDNANWHGNKYHMLVGTFYVQFLSQFAETLFARQTQIQDLKKLPTSLFDRKERYKDTRKLREDFQSSLQVNNGQGTCLEKLNALLNELGSKFKSIETIANRFFSGADKLYKTKEPISHLRTKVDKEWVQTIAPAGATNFNGKNMIIVINEAAKDPTHTFIHELLHAARRGTAYEHSEMIDAIQRIEGRKDIGIDNFIGKYCRKKDVDGGK